MEHNYKLKRNLDFGQFHKTGSMVLEWNYMYSGKCLYVCRKCNFWSWIFSAINHGFAKGILPFQIQLYHLIVGGQSLEVKFTLQRQLLIHWKGQDSGFWLWNQNSCWKGKLSGKKCAEGWILISWAKARISFKIVCRAT